MTFAPTKNENRLLSISVLAWVLCLAALEFSYVTADPDLWGHLYFGMDHWRTGALQRTDPYSFTAPGWPWINHEWLAELLFYLVYDRLGDPGLLMGKLLLGLTVVLTVWRLAQQGSFDPLVAVPVFGAAVMTMKPGFMIRPQLFSFLLFAVVLCLLHAHRRGRRHRLAGLPIVMALWANLHGGFLMGGLLVAVFTLSETAAALRGGRKGELAALWGWSSAGALATLANPYGIGLHKFLAHTLSLPRNITEWAPVPLLSGDFLGFKILSLAVCIALWRRRDWSSWESIVPLVIGAAAWRQQRHVVFFAIAAAPLVVNVFSEMLDRYRTVGRPVRLSSGSAAFLAAVLVVFAAGSLFKTLDRYGRCQMRIFVNPAEYPVQAMAFLKHNAFAGNLLVDFNWGEYAIWHLYPRCRVSIDGRFRTAYPQQVIDDHFMPRQDPAKWHRTLSRYPADILLVGQEPFFQNLVRQNGPWVYVYSDRLAMVFVRDRPQNRPMIDRIRQGRMRYQDLAQDPYFPG